MTGGTRRLGRIIAEAVAADGFDIVATHSGEKQIDSAELSEFRAHIEDRYGVDCVTVWADLSDSAPDTITRVLAVAPSPLFGLVNNAGMFKWDDLATLERARIEDTLALNLVAPMLLTSAFSRAIGARPGVVVFMLDQKIANPYPDHLSYTVSKGALHMLLTMCAREPGRAIRFYGLAPGLTIPAPGQTVANFEAAQKTTPLGLSPTPDEIAHAIRFLFRCTATNGFTLILDGGTSLAPRARDFEFHGVVEHQLRDP